MSSYQTMKEIGADYSLSSHKVGKILTESGLRVNGRPSSRAFDEKWVEQKFTGDYTNYLWAWHGPKTRSLLESLGHKRKLESGNALVACTQRSLGPP